MLNQMLVNNIQRFGFNKYEARAYTVLVVHGPLTASLISNYSKIPQSKVYETMKSLQRKSLIENCFSKPIRFKAKDPKIVFNNLIEEKRDKINKLEKASKQSFTRLKHIPMRTKQYEISALKTNKEFVDSISDILKSSSSFFYFFTDRFPRKKSLDSAINDTKTKNINFLTPKDMSKHSGTRAAWYKKNNVLIKVIGTKGPVFAVSEKGLCIDIGSDSPQYIWSDSAHFINILKNHFESLWKDAKLF